MSDAQQLTDQDLDALDEIDRNTSPGQQTQYAVVYARNGQRVAEGPIPWEVAKDKADRYRGVMVHRTVQYTPWEASDA